MIKIIFRFILIYWAIIISFWLVPGVDFHGDTARMVAFIYAFVLALINVFLNLILRRTPIKLTILSFGLFLFFTNFVILILLSGMNQFLDIRFIVNGLTPAFWTSVLVSLVSLVTLILFPDRV